MDENFVYITVASLDGHYELTATITPEFDYENLVLTVKLPGVESISYDNDDWLMNELMPRAEIVCQGIGEYVEDEQFILGELGIPHEGICQLHYLFELAKDYGIIIEDSLFDDLSFSLN